MSQETGNKIYSLVIILSIVIVLLAAGLYASISGAAGGGRSYNILPSSEPKTISVSGSASASVIPDKASINLGVLTQAATAKEASEKNSALMTAVIGGLEKMGIENKDIQTSYLSIQPLYNYPKEGGAPTITGYSASNNVRVTAKTPQIIGEIVDKSVSSGANQISEVSFVVSEEKQKQIHDELLAGAVIDAKGKADKLAQNLKARITGVRTASISDVSQPYAFAPVFAEKAATPVQPGESRVTLSVQVTYLIE